MMALVNSQRLAEIETKARKPHTAISSGAALELIQTVRALRHSLAAAIGTLDEIALEYPLSYDRQRRIDSCRFDLEETR